MGLFDKLKDLRNKKNEEVASQPGAWRQERRDAIAASEYKQGAIGEDFGKIVADFQGLGRDLKLRAMVEIEADKAFLRGVKKSAIRVYNEKRRDSLLKSIGSCFSQVESAKRAFGDDVRSVYSSYDEALKILNAVVPGDGRKAVAKILYADVQKLSHQVTPSVSLVNGYYATAEAIYKNSSGRTVKELEADLKKMKDSVANVVNCAAKAKGFARQASDLVSKYHADIANEKKRAERKEKFLNFKDGVVDSVTTKASKFGRFFHNTWSYLKNSMVPVNTLGYQKERLSNLKAEYADKVSLYCSETGFTRLPVDCIVSEAKISYNFDVKSSDELLEELIELNASYSAAIDSLNKYIAGSRRTSRRSSR